MELNEKQIEGLELAIERYRNGEKYSVIAGYAGTGKSTLVQHIIASLNMHSDDVVYAAYTGKATLVLSRKGCKNTSTLHKLLYNARLNTRTGTYSFFPRESLEKPYKIIVVDEVSMVNREFWELLLSHKAYVLALGDPGQLGPIRADDDLGLLKNPHIFLDEIMRQEEGNEIIHLSMEIRQGKPLYNFQGKQVQVINKDEVTTGMLEWADQILCAKNDTRHTINNHVRELEGRGSDPEIGDKIICLRNYWDILSKKEGDPLVNGTIGFITRVQKKYDMMLGFEILIIDFVTELGDVFLDVNIDYKLIMEGESSIPKHKIGDYLRNINTKNRIPKEFAFGSAITTWKAQGSEWDNILLFEESFPFKVDEHKRYLYTGITRASSKIVVVKK